MCVISFYRCLDENVDGTGGEGEFVEQEEQDQGLFANQGKPSLDHTIVLLFLCITLPFCNLHIIDTIILVVDLGVEMLDILKGMVNLVDRVPIHLYSAIMPSKV